MALDEEEDGKITVEGWVQNLSPEARELATVLVQLTPMLVQSIREKENMWVGLIRVAATQASKETELPNPVVVTASIDIGPPPNVEEIEDPVSVMHAQADGLRTDIFHGVLALTSSMEKEGVSKWMAFGFMLGLLIDTDAEEISLSAIPIPVFDKRKNEMKEPGKKTEWN
jgi:hypothetical protein